MRGLLSGLNYVHEQNYIHRDIKLDNIQLAPVGEPQDSHLKIIDFGFSAKQRVGVKLTHEEKIGTVLYMAPEQISSQSYSKKIDIYAAGISLYFMLVGYHPLYIQGGILNDNSYSLKQKVAAIEPEKWHYPSFVSTLAKDIICKLCRISQIERYDAKRALQHPWITGRFDEKIPLTASEEIQMFNQEQVLQKFIRVVQFLSVIKKDKDCSSQGNLTSILNSGIKNYQRKASLNKNSP